MAERDGETLSDAAEGYELRHFDDLNDAALSVRRMYERQMTPQEVAALEHDANVASLVAAVLVFIRKYGLGPKAGRPDYLVSMTADEIEPMRIALDRLLSAPQKSSSERDGETLSDERIADLRAKMQRPGMGALAAIPSPRELTMMLNEICALRAQLAEARADTERLEFVEELIVDACGRPFHLLNAKSNGLVRIETWGSDSFRSIVDAERAARAVAGPHKEDSHG